MNERDKAKATIVRIVAELDEDGVRRLTRYAVDLLRIQRVRAVADAELAELLLDPKAEA